MAIGDLDGVQRHPVPLTSAANYHQARLVRAFCIALYRGCVAPASGLRRALSGLRRALSGLRRALSGLRRAPPLQAIDLQRKKGLFFASTFLLPFLLPGQGCG